MKKILALLFLLLIPFVAKAEVKISDAVLVDNTEGLEVEKNPHYEGLQLDIDMKLAEVGEFAKYKLTIQNDTKKDYEIDMGEAFSDKEYIKYEFSFVGEDNSVLKASESKDIYVTVSYNKEVPETEFKNGVYNDDNVMTINLSNEEQEVNPDTKTGYIILITAIILFISLLLVLLNKYKLDHLMVLVIAVAIALPISIYALEKITIKIQAKIQIVYNQPRFCVGDYNYETGKVENIQYYNYSKGTTWNTFLNSSLNNNYFRQYHDLDYIIPYNQNGFCEGILEYNKEQVKPVDTIIDSKTGCYDIYAPPC